jgi:DNA-binding NtrC family response regulator
VRVISATNADLQKAIVAGQFREDLFFRLNVIELRVPSLAQRSEDIPLLSEQFLKRSTADSGLCQLAPDALDALLGYDWPGNVRELQNRMQRASLVCRDQLIRAADLALPVSTPAARPSHVGSSGSQSSESPLNSAADEPERAQIEEALSRAGGVVSKAAAQLGLSRQALYRRMELLGLSLERRVRD